MISKKKKKKNWIKILFIEKNFLKI
jgi:hypothetical protein